MKYLGLVLLLFVSFFGYSQDPIKRYICTDATRSELRNDGVKAEESASFCDSGTQVYGKVVSGPDLIVGDPEVIRVDKNGPHRVQVNVNWAVGKTGIAVIEVYYRKRIKHGFRGCKWDDRFLYSYELHREFINPSGTYSPIPAVAYVSAANPTAEFNLNYKPLTNIPSVYVVKKIHYKDGTDPNWKEVPVTRANVLTNVYNSTAVKFHAPGIGKFFMKSEVYFETDGGCGRWLPIDDMEINVYSNCYLDDVTNVSVGLTGLTRLPQETAPAFRTSVGQSYSLETINIGDFAGNYTWNFSDFGSDVTRNGNSFTPLKKGSYRISVKSLEEGCPVPSEMLVLVDGENLYVDKICSVRLPADLKTVYPDVIEDNDVVLRHFTAYVKSKRYIILEPGITLEQGAELILDRPDPQPGDEGTEDLKMNFTEQVSFDEYGNVLGQSRSYFDHKGTSLQTQYKNFSSQVVMANATLYDAIGRPAISTLPAPVRASAAVECPVDDKTGTPVNFIYKPDFVKAGPNLTDIYNYTHFDLNKENSPLAVDASLEGTLGWYYSSNNGTSTNPNMNEPLVATTQYPYSRTLFYNDGTGDVKGVTKPGDAFKAGSPYLTTTLNEGVSTADSYFNTDYNSYLSIRQNELGLARPASIQGQFFKTTTTDGIGKKTVTYTDKSGKTIIALYFGSGTTPITKSYQFYDFAGRLLVSISPNGLNQYTGSNFDQIDKTRNFYNGKGQLVAAEEKSAGGAVNSISRSEFIYRKDGKIRFSQNAEQRKAVPPRYSYTNYDVAGKAFESGEYVTNASSIAFNSIEMKAILENKEANGGLLETAGTKTERSISIFDEVQSTIPAGYDASGNVIPSARQQHFVYGAISSTKKDNAITTWYSYDERGRVEWMVQDIKDLGVKTVDYRYGSNGQVQDVVYQQGIDGEQFIHHYEYDPDGRLKKVYTTRELLVYNIKGKLINKGVEYASETDWEIINPGKLELQATYYYYLHGPLKRIELANKLQGIDYVYTADGALKSINHSEPEGVNNPGVTKDPGKDGVSNGFKKDVFGMALDYYPNDYIAANGTSNKAISNADNQYTGLIKAIRWHSPIEPYKQFAYTYKYDQRNQLSKAQWGTVSEELVTHDMIVTPTPFNPYQEEIPSYDANGNINALKRNASLDLPGNSNANITIADFAYHYKTNTNMLDNITQGNETFRAYLYDDLGQMVKETEDSNSKFIVYNVTGKVTAVYSDVNHTKPVTLFTYDDRGFRLRKLSYYYEEEGVFTLSTWYVRDASGNIITTYEQDSHPGEKLKPVDIPVYASGRIGMYKPEFGITFYELTDHLGNVRAVIREDPKEELEFSYMATMETERVDQEENKDGFVRLGSEPTADYINHTPVAFKVDKQTYHIEAPNKVDRINNRPNGDLHPAPIGTGIMLWVHPGDKIDMEVFAKYTNYDANNTNVLAAVAGFLTTSFTTVPVVDGASLFNVMNTPGFSTLPAWANLNDNQPRAFLNYLLFDNNNILIDYQFDQVSSAAKIPQTNPFAHPHERLALENITIEKEGYMYVYVSNQSDQNMEVYFDDLTVKQKLSQIVAGGDFYPFGLAIKDRQIERDIYRNGYQGQFAEKDDETGWNHFELREYNPTIGRWTSKDPKHQYHSPYIGMGNNPTHAIDPDGAYSILGALWRTVAYGESFTSKVVDGKRTYGYVDRRTGYEQYGNNSMAGPTHTYGDLKSYDYQSPPPEPNATPYLSISLGKESSEGSLLSYNTSLTLTSEGVFVTPIGADITLAAGGTPISGMSVSLSAGVVIGPTEGLSGYGLFGTAGAYHTGVQYARGLNNNEYYFPNGLGDTHTIGVVLSTSRFWIGGGGGYTIPLKPLTGIK